MKKLLPVLLGLVVGLVFTKIFYDSYNVSYALNENTLVYVFQQGVYSSKQSVIENVTLNYYIYEKSGDMYYVYAGFTTKSKNVQKLKDFFEKKGYSIYVKEINLPSSNFTEVLKQYDLLLERTDDENAIEAINASILSEYEEAYGEN